jgi:hypothetical protein
MTKRIITFLLILFYGIAPGWCEKELEDDHLRFNLKFLEDKLEGGSVQLEGFKISMNLPGGFISKGFTIDDLHNLVANQHITGEVTYPKGKKTPINYEIVNHRGVDDIYMKSSLGYFTWERITLKKNELSFVIYWWYCPPARPVDLEILAMACRLLSDKGNWHQKDDRKCDNDIKENKWSLFCALKHASLEKTGEYNHHNRALQTVRFVIDDLVPGHDFAHTLMDYNNSLTTTHEDIMMVLELAKKRIEDEIRIEKSETGKSKNK